MKITWYSGWRENCRDDDDDGNRDEIAQDRRDRSGESGVEVNVGRTTTVVASSTKIPEAVLEEGLPPLADPAEYFHERVGREREARAVAKQK